ncbi:MAG: hypothetical protein H6970_13215 [Gammaproteobacteria bacterium]|nr:hypothetical protein [Gammaproteobacteria bacterium]MCP5458677.1 hypothetical protein [Gammaproteobacteria bacterium]
MGIVNRHWFAERVSQLLRQMTPAQRHALLQVEVGGPRDIEPDVHRAFAERYGDPEALLQSLLPPRVWMTRLSAYRYRLFLPDHTRSQALSFAGQIVDFFKQAPVQWQGQTRALNVVLGLVAITRRSLSIDEVFSQATAACREARGANQRPIGIRTLPMPVLRDINPGLRQIG